MRKRTGHWSLFLGDAAAILAFVLIGLVSHEEGITLSGLARTALPILGVWFAAAPLLNTYRRPGWHTMVATLAVAILGGLVLRRVIFHRPADLSSFFTFLGVAFLFTLAFLSAWRVVAWRLGLSGAVPAGMRRSFRK